MNGRIGRLVVLFVVTFAGLESPAVHAEKTSHSAIEPKPLGSVSWHTAHHQSKLRLAETGAADLLLIGDGKLIRIGKRELVESVWGESLARRGVLSLCNGVERTQSLLWRLGDLDFRDLDPKLVVLHVGGSNLYDNTAVQIVEGILLNVAELRHKLPNSTILVLGIIPEGRTADVPPRIRGSQTNRILGEAIRELDDAKVEFLDVNQEFLDEDGTIRDGLFKSPDYRLPTVQGYEIWAKAMESTVKRILGD
jgi:lysophospholipase L1-like esterase